MTDTMINGSERCKEPRRTSRVALLHLIFDIGSTKVTQTASGAVLDETLVEMGPDNGFLPNTSEALRLTFLKLPDPTMK